MRPVAPVEFQTNFKALLADCGQRASYELDVACPRYQEDSRPLLKIIRRYAHSATPGAAANGEITWGRL
ncbi:MAG: hypothetical protein U0401_19875 [Anaerolineae bacterium]